MVSHVLISLSTVQMFDISYIYVLIYENGVKDLHPKHPYFTLISLNL